MSDLQQLIRIILQIAAGYIFGEAVANSSEFQAALSGLISIATFAW